jgi:hypothetical protein
VGLTPFPAIRQVLEAPVAAATASPSSHGEARPPLKKVHTKGCLPPSARYVHVGTVFFLCNLPTFIAELEILWSLGGKRTLGTLNFH